MTPLDSFPDPQLFDRFLAGECTPHEAQRVRQWLSGQPAMQSVVAQLRTDDVFPDVTTDESSRATIDTDWQRVRAMVGFTEQSSASTTSDVSSYLSASRHATQPERHDIANVSSFRAGARASLQMGRRSLVVWSAVCAMIAVIVLGLFTVSSPIARDDTSAPRIFVTRAGERATVNLADGSYVMLGPLSRLTVTADFGSAARRLTLRGSGFFSVSQESDLPFIVDAGRAQVRVLGTAFGVRSYPEEGRVTVAVRSGRVAITDSSSFGRATRTEVPPLIASASDVARLDAQGATVTRRATEAIDVLAWTEGRLVFRDVPLRDVLAELARWFDVQFQVTDPALNSVPITAGFSNQSIEELPDALSFILPVRVMQSGRVLTITPRL